MRLRAFAFSVVIGVLTSWTSAHAGFLNTSYGGKSFPTGGGNTALGTNNPSVTFKDGTNATNYTLTIGPNPPTAIPGLTNLLTNTFTGPDSLGHTFGKTYDLVSTPFTGTGNELTVKSYAAFTSGGLVGANMYVSYTQNGGNDPAAASVQWIQVLTTNWAFVTGGSKPGMMATKIDVGAANTTPFYNDGGDANKGGSTYLFDEPSRLASKLATYKGAYPLSLSFETFAVVDTHTLDANKKDVIDVYGGFSWGWSVTNAAVPEPSSIILFGIAGSIVLIFARFRSYTASGRCGY
jgi:hypothetical protein